MHLVRPCAAGGVELHLRGRPLGMREEREVGCLLETDQLLVHAEGFGYLAELLVASVGALEASVDGDHPVGAWDLQLEVGVMRDRHEAREHGASEDGVVLGWPVNHIELKGLTPEIIWAAEEDIQNYAPEGKDCRHRHNPVKGCGRPCQAVEADVHGPKGVGVDDVEAAPRIDEYLLKVVAPNLRFED